MDSRSGAALSVRSPHDLLATVPYLLGFHPERSLVVAGLRGSRLIFTARVDLPPRSPADAVRSRARRAAALVARQGVEAALLIGYGPAEAVLPLLEAVRAALDARGVTISEELRVEADRYWSLLCGRPGCCPPEGIPFDPSGSAIAAAAAVAGEIALPDRAALVARVAPVGDGAREAVTEATGRADDRLSELLASAHRTDLLGSRTLRAAGMTAIEEAIAHHRAGRRLTDDQVAWLTVVLLHPPVRDHAWAATDGRDWAIDLWTDVLRRTADDLVAAPACLLAFAAWRAGRGPLANVALERALHADPAYPMALILEDILCRGVPPTALDGWPHPTVLRSPLSPPPPPRRRRRRTVPG